MKRNKKRQMLLMLLTFLLSVVWSGQFLSDAAASNTDSHGLSAEKREEKLKGFADAAERLYAAMQQGKTAAAHQEMDRLIEALEGLSFKGLTSVDGIHALAECIMDTRETINRAELSPEAWRETSARLRLAVNSLIQERDALWQQYYKVMSSQLAEMDTARAGGKRSSFQEALQAFQQHYELIRPAALIQRGPSELTKFDSWISLVGRLGFDKNWDEAKLKEVLPHGKPLLKQLFGRKGYEPVFLPLTGSSNPWHWTALIGGWIMLALIYTGLRKYEAWQAVSLVRKPPQGNGSLFRRRD